MMRSTIRFLANYAVQISIVVIGGIILAFIIQADRFSPNNPQSTPTPNGFQLVQTAEAQLTQLALTGIAYNLTVTHVSVQSANSTATTQQFSATETAAYATLYALSATPTPTPTLSPEQLALTPVTSNGDWDPYERDFDGVTMVLVPAGCFEMGSEDGQSDEQPVETICFEEPFWIDRYEVTNAQYGSIGCEQWSSQPEQPRNCVDWFNARDFCEARGTRLPTEAEWEYVARGPDNLVYPWGNEFIGDNVVYSANSNNETATVGSRPAGTSWVGAMDMAGNLWEWTSSLYEAYPYGEDHESNSNTSNLRVWRDRSFSATSDFLRSALRGMSNPTFDDSNFGFRCARDLEG